MKHAFLPLILAGALLSPAQTTTKSTATKSTAASKSATKARPAPASANLLNPSALKAIAPASYRVKLTTTKGDVIIQVTREWAPLGADRFYNLVRAGFYTNCAFYRTLPGFMTQFGISARPDVTKAWEHTQIKDDPVKKSNTRGMVTFATAGPNTRTTQLFINYANNSNLDRDPGVFAPFGEVIEGMSVVDSFYTGYGAQPANEFEKIEEQGKPFLDRYYPKLDRILTASIVPATPAVAPAASKSTK